jgi:hypothetical protein
MSEVAKKGVVMKKAVAVCLFVVTGVCLQAQTLSWDLRFTKMVVSGETETLPVDETISMKKGDTYLITLTPANDCYCYVVKYDRAGKISVLYDQPVKGSKVTNMEAVTIEDPRGTDTLYVIMSLKRQTKLEGLIKSFNNDSSRQNTTNLREELASLQKTTSEGGEPPVFFVQSAGTKREIQPPYVTQFSGKDIYVRTIAIRN